MEIKKYLFLSLGFIILIASNNALTMHQSKIKKFRSRTKKYQHKNKTVNNSISTPISSKPIPIAKKYWRERKYYETRDFLQVAHNEHKMFEICLKQKFGTQKPQVKSENHKKIKKSRKREKTQKTSQKHDQKIEKIRKKIRDNIKKEIRDNIEKEEPETQTSTAPFYFNTQHTILHFCSITNRKSTTTEEQTATKNFLSQDKNNIKKK